MILENSKKNSLKVENVIRILMAVIFLSAGLFRIFNPELAKLELVSLKLPEFFTWFILIIEIVGGTMLLLNKKIKLILIIFILFLLFALINALFVNGITIFSQIKELFVFNANPTDFFLHFIYLFILVILLLLYRKKDL